jgi:hypothetical protein
MDRILQGTPAPIGVTFASAGAPVDPTPPNVSVTITRADGTVLVDHLNATHNGTGVFGYQLSTAHTALLDRLTAVWSSPNLGSRRRSATRSSRATRSRTRGHGTA